MTTITPTALKAYAEPELDSLSDPQLQRALDKAGIIVSESAWGDSYTQGMLALAAHFAYLASVVGETGGGGAVIMEKEGDVERRYSQANAGASEFESTGFGSTYMMLRRTIVGAPYCV